MVFKVFGPEVLTHDDVNNMLMKQANIVCTSSTRPASPVDGMEIYETDTGRKRRYYAATASWLMWPAQASEDFDGTNISTTSIFYAAGSPNVSLTVTAPPSGRAFITVGGNIEGNDSDNTSAYLSYEIRVTDSSGSVTTAASDSAAFVVQGSHNVQGQFRTLRTGLTPGQVYFIRTMHKSTSAVDSVTFFSRRLTFEPCPN